jgi:hypothetical protein
MKLLGSILLFLFLLLGGVLHTTMASVEISHFQQDNKYQEIILRGDSFFINKSYEAAIIEYKKALAIKPTATYPKQKIEQIKQLKNLRHNQKPYQERIHEGDKLMAQEKYEDAINIYNEAIAIRPTEQYPKNRIKEIQKRQNEEWKLRQVYHQTIQEADRLFAQGITNSALVRYQDAHRLIPKESYPNEMIQKIQSQLTLESNAQTKYENFISTGLENLKKENLQLAKKAFSSALQIKKNDPFSTKKLAEIEVLITSFEEKERLYTISIQRGDVFLKQKLYNKARNSYSTALSHLNRSYPREKLNEINKLMQAKKKKGNSTYKRLIKEGDKLFSGLMYVQALNSFTNANKLKPKEDYPITMIAKIQEELNKAGLRKLLTTAETIAKNSKKQFSFKPIPKADRNDNYFHIELSNLSDSEVKVHLNFGMKEAKNGGYAFDLAKNESKKIIIPIGNKLKWFSEDNNWVSIYCLKGELKIKTFEILKSKHFED